MDALQWILFLCFVSGLRAVPLLTSVTSSIKLFEENDPDNSTSLDHTSSKVIGIDYHYGRGEIYCSDGNGRIYRSWLKPRNQDPVIIVEVKLSDGVAVDWINDNLYWTDVAKSTVETSDLDGHFRRTLFNSSHGVEKPRAIVVDPFKGLLFWSDWGVHEKIESSGLDGQQQKTIVSSRMFWPNGLALDLPNEKVYILDGFLSILSSCNYDGTDWKVIKQSSENFHQSFGLTFYSGTIYWGSWRSHSLNSMHVASGLTKTVLQQSGIRAILERFMGLKAVHPSLQRPLTRANPCSSAGCSHKCLTGRDLNTTCVCPFGFNLGPDNKTCVEEGYLLVSWSLTIRRLSLQGKITEPMIDGTKSAVSIDYHYNKNFIFWSDIQEHRIYRAHINQLNNKTVVAHPETCDGLAVDWVHDVLYWTDTYKNTLEASQLDGSKHMVIFSENMDQPRDIVLDPFEGFMFFSDWGQTPKIERAYLDGSYRKTIIREDISWPNGMTIDRDRKLIYWVDGKLATISSSAYDGSQRNTVLSSQTVSEQPFGISLFQDNLYWTDWISRGLFKADKVSITSAHLLANSSTILLRPYGVKVIHSALQKPKNNPCASLRCRELCLGSNNARGARCMGSEDPSGGGEPETPPEHSELTYLVSNDTMQLTLTSTKAPSLVVITITCIRREGCLEDQRCSQDHDRVKVFKNQKFFSISGLLQETHYKVNFESPQHNEELVVFTGLTDPPEVPKVKGVEAKGKKATLKWDPVDACTSSFQGYHYKLFKTETEDQQKQEGSTNSTEVTFENLEPEVEYTAQIYTSDPKKFSSISFSTHAMDEQNPECQKEELLCDGKEDCTDKSDEDITSCAAITNIIVYQKNSSTVYLRLQVSNSTLKKLERFTADYGTKESSEMKNHFESHAFPCLLWPQSFCFHISSLASNKEYTFNVSAVLSDGKVGNPYPVKALTKEGMPGPPEDLRVTSYSPTSVTMQFKHPEQSNGIVRNFMVTILEVERFDAATCCQNFPLLEYPANTEEPEYTVETSDFVPAATYAITITSKTVYVGGSKEVEAFTSPPALALQKYPIVNISTLVPLSWEPYHAPTSDNSLYHPLIKFYFLLRLLPQNDQQKSGKNHPDLGPLQPLLESTVGSAFEVLWHKNASEAIASQEPIVVSDLTLRKQHQMAWIQVSQYMEAYGVDFIKSDPFIPV